MAKFVGIIGFSIPTDNGKGSYKPVIEEKPYSGNLIQNRKRINQETKENQDFSLHVDISIILDPYGEEHIYDMAYVIWRGKAWKIVSISEEYPRVTLSLGGLYNGKQADKHSD